MGCDNRNMNSANEWQFSLPTAKVDSYFQMSVSLSLELLLLGIMVVQNLFLLHLISIFFFFSFSITVLLCVDSLFFLE